MATFYFLDTDGDHDLGNPDNWYSDANATPLPADMGRLLKSVL